MENNYQDSLSINAKITTGTQLSLPKPVLQAIPETPVQHLSQQTKVIPRKENKIYVATQEDSLLFNLIVPAEETANVYKQNLAWDYLHPLKFSDKEWIGRFSESEDVSRPVISQSVTAEVEPVVSKGDSVLETLSHENDAFIVDSMCVEEGEKSDSIENNASNVDKDSLSTTVSKSKISNRGNDNFIPDQYRDVISGLLILSVAILGFLRMTNYKYLRELFSSVVYRQDARKMQKAINLRNQIHSHVLELLFLFNTAMFVYEAILYYNVDTALGQKLILIPVIMLGVLVYGFVKLLLYQFVGFVFEKEEQTHEYVYYTKLHSKVFGLILLPIALVIPYIDLEMVPVLIKIGIGIFILLYIMQIFRGVTIILKNLSSFFYMFLYLCALEILPLIILYQLIII